ncbi:signal peptide peptidase SppA [Sandaracinobacter neustonicus]|uniref:Signal peptide peptidase SppA n=1 Tax=Sandaracinobacter neustonicus TaxID=1715348 RepID=A0A501XKU5_9SPHN|nr:signal peptide peptidase SppA [Sandaracinobacter neustonicus]TPE61176.1 signal peptide peptidase SppA [Sandaracinobacter neustonicus]
MQFLKGVWTFLVGVKDALVLIFMLLVFGLLWAGLSMGGRSAVTVPQGAALNIDMDGLLVDQATEVDPLTLLGGQQVIPETETLALVRAIDKAADDPAISMITLNLDGFMGGGQANLESVGAALKRFRAKKKEVEAWATAYTDDGYYLAAHADSIGISPLGAMALSGPGGSGLYFKDALDKLKVNVEVFRVGTYKSFVEPFTRNQASPEAKEADQVLANDLWATWRTAVQRERQELDVAATLASWPQRVAGANQTQAELAKNAGFVDVVISENAWRAKLRERLGEGEDADRPGDFKRIDVRDYWAARRPVGESGPAVAVVHVTGSIVDGEAPPGTAGGATVRELIEDAVADGDVKAIVVRVDSGGGSVLASEEIRQALLEARAKKLPVIASFGPVAASGGYWVGTGADMIFASPATITGSIGVFGVIPTFEGTLKQLGVSTDGVKTTPFSGQPDVVGGLNDPTRTLIQAGVQDVYREFVGLVAAARKLPVAQVEPIAEGRVWSGTRAKELKLIDRYGDLQDAVREAGRRAELKGEPRIKVMTPPKSFLVEILSKLEGGEAAHASAMNRDAMARAVAISRLRAAAQVQAAISVASGPTVQVHCLTCMGYSIPSRAAAPAELLPTLKALLAD